MNQLRVLHLGATPKSGKQSVLDRLHEAFVEAVGGPLKQLRFISELQGYRSAVAFDPYDHKMTQFRAFEPRRAVVFPDKRRRGSEILFGRT